MKTLALLALLFGCKDPYADDSTADDSDTTTDDSATDDSATDDTSQPEEQDITGGWLSEGDNISELFRLPIFDYVSIVANFGTDGSYDVVATNGDGVATTLTGTYVVDITPVIPTIVLSQVTPSEATAEGIWQIQGGELHDEVVQTVPDYGFSPPTPEAGFGSTSGTGLTPGMNVQIYVKN